MSAFADELAILREDLAALVAKTAGADRLAPPGAFIGPPQKRGAGWRRVQDDLDAGRLSFRAAHFAAKHGLAALDAVDLARAALAQDGADVDTLERLLAEIDDGVDLAKAAAAHARALYTDAIERAAGAKGLAALRQSAKERGRAAKPQPVAGTRGRPSAAERDRLIAAAIADAQTRGWRGTAAVADAKRLRPELFVGLGVKGIYAAAQRAKKLATKTPVKPSRDLEAIFRSQ